MNTCTMDFRRGLTSAFALLLLITTSPAAVMAAGSSVKIAGNSVFTIQNGSGGLSSSQRAQVVQNNLDNALIASANRQPSTVRVVYVKGTPVITVGGYSVVTVDSQAAKMAGTTPSILAKRWADRIKASLANSASINAYVSTLSSGSVSGGATNYHRARIVYVPAGMVLPITLTTSISSATAGVGDKILAQLSEDVTLDNAVIPAGSVISGSVREAKVGARMSHSGALMVKFDTLTTPDGSSSKITAHLIGGVGKNATVDGATFKGETTSSKVKTAAIHGAVGAGAGTLAGMAIGAIAGHGRGTGRGALAGLAIGAGLGVAESLMLRKGKDAVLQSGQSMQLQLDAPATIAVTQSAAM